MFETKGDYIHAHIITGKRDLRVIVIYKGILLRLIAWNLLYVEKPEMIVQKVMPIDGD